MTARDVLEDEVDEDPDAPTGPYVLTQRALKDAGVCLSDEQLDKRLPIPTEVTMENLGKALDRGVPPQEILWGLYCGLDLPREVILAHVSWMVGRVIDAAASAKPDEGEDEVAHRQWIQSRVMRAIEGIAINCAEQSGMCAPHQSYKEERREQCRALVRMLEKK